MELGQSTSIERRVAGLFATEPEKGAAHSSPPKTKRLWVEYPARRKMIFIGESTLIN
jgi:hypothetical protein